MTNDLNKMISLYEKYEKQREKFENKVRKVCDFNARVTFCAGDGHVIIDEETAEVATPNCLFGKTKKNKLTKEEHEKFCI